MKKSCFFLTSIIILYSFKEIQNEEKIIWNKSLALTWQNFKSKPDITSKLVALSTCKINTDVKVKDDSDSIEFTIKSYFLSYDSWVKATEKNDYLLKHEQGHFDLNEVYARRIRQELMVTKFKLGTLPVVFREITTKFFKELNAMQLLYDSETVHSQDKSRQEEWDIKIYEQLKKLEQYSSSTIVVPY